MIILIILMRGQLYLPYHQELSPVSIYIGGGTPNLLKNHHYAKLMTLIRRNFPKLKPETPITLEGIPQLFSRDKLEGD
ncbi:MAG: hypothetical protein R2865_12065 [Deinococcales bacterium]